MNEKEFASEQAHLTQTYLKLSAMKKELEEKIETIMEKAAKEKQDIRSNLSLNLDSDTDAMETYIEFEAMSHSIDQYNIEQNAAVEKLGRVDRLLRAPYFARVRLRFDPLEEPEDYYIGSAGITENKYMPLVIDWRSPVAETYYNQENGKTHYTVDGRRVEAELMLRRQYEIERDKLKAFFDTQVAIEDPLLLQSLSDIRTDKMRSITATIQKEQNAVIRCGNVPVLLVEGIAGSGKTSVLLQRIAYLFYRQRENLRPEQVYLMTINPVFRRYIDHVLPDLGEENPHTITWRDFLQMTGVPAQLRDGSTTRENLLKIEKELAHVHLTRDDFVPVWQKSYTVLTADDIAQTAAQYRHIETGERLITILGDALRERARSRIRAMERDRREEDSENTEEDTSYAGAYSEEMSTKEENRVQNQYGGAFKALDHFAFLDITRIGKRILGTKQLTATEWLWLKLLLTGTCERNARYVMIDEVQDYTMAQIMVLQRYFVNAKFMMLGDEFQAIRRGTLTFAQVRDLFASKGREVAQMSLMTSYRSSPEITALFTSLLPRSRKIRASSVRRPGTAPQILPCAAPGEYTQALLDALQAAHKETGLTAVICRSERSLLRTKERLESAGEACPPVTVVHKNESLPKSGICMLALDLVKGLEFDGVIIPDADANGYPVDLLSAHRLYTAISRATSRLTILSYGAMTELFAETED